MPLISNCSMMPAWHQLVSMSGHVEESETARKLQLYATSIYQVHSFVCQLDYNVCCGESQNLHHVSSLCIQSIYEYFRVFQQENIVPSGKKIKVEKLRTICLKCHTLSWTRAQEKSKFFVPYYTIPVQTDCPIKQQCLIWQHIVDLGNIKFETITQCIALIQIINVLFFFFNSKC